MNKQLRYRTMTTAILAGILVATLALLPLADRQSFAHQLDTFISFGFDNNPVIEGDAVIMTAEVTTIDTGAHSAIDPVEIGSGRIQQGVDGDDNPVSDCDSVIDWINLSNTTPIDGLFTYDGLDTNGLGGQTLVFRAHYVTPGGGHTVATIHSGCEELDIEILSDPFDGFKTWTHTDYNWDQICDTDPVDGVEEIVGGICQTEYRDRNIDNPFDEVLADSLDPPTEDGISDVIVQVKESGEISNMNPGAIYALTTVNVLTDLDMLQVDENYGECTDEELELLNQNNLSRNVKVAVADPNGDVTEVTDRLYDELDNGVVFVEEVDSDSAKVKINDSSLLTEESTIYVLVKFDDQLKGEDSSILPLDCVNTEDVTSTIGQDEFSRTFEATLKFTEAP